MAVCLVFERLGLLGCRANSESVRAELQTQTDELGSSSAPSGEDDMQAGGECRLFKRLNLATQLVRPINCTQTTSQHFTTPPFLLNQQRLSCSQISHTDKKPTSVHSCTAVQRVAPLCRGFKNLFISHMQTSAAGLNPKPLILNPKP